MIESETSPSPRVSNPDLINNGDISSTTIKTDNRNFDNINAPQDLLATSTIINGGKWVILSNRLVAYWPFAIKTIQDTHQKYLSFQFPTVGLFVTILYIFLNVSYLTNYFIDKLGNTSASKWHRFDQICMVIWDTMIIGGETLCRIYGIWRIPKLHSFWNNIVNILGQCTNLSSGRETEEKFQKLEKWGFKWFVTFTAIGIISGSVYFYNAVFNFNYPLLQAIKVVYLDTVISSHNASAFFLIFFIKIMTHGFTTCRTKLEEISNQNIDHTSSNLNLNEKNTLPKIFKLIRDLEECVASFNTTFVFILFLEVTFSFWQVMFALYFFQAVLSHSYFLSGINMMMPIISYTTCLVLLCKESSKLTGECQKMVATFQELPISTAEDERKVQLLVSRLTSEPPGIQVSQLIDIRESLLGSALNTLATYFIVLVQMRQMAQETNPSVTGANQTNDTDNATKLDYW